MPAKKQVGLREVRVGLLIVVAIAVLIFLLLNASGDISLFASTLPLRARFASAEGIRAGSEVQLAGVRIGTVDEVVLLPPQDNPGAPRVEALLQIDETIDGAPAQQRIRTDSTAQLSSPSLLAPDRVINIAPGTTAADPVPPNFLLPTTAADTIADLTASGRNLTEQLNQLSVEVTDIARKINEGEGALGRFVNDESAYNNLNATIREAQDLINRIRTGQGSASRLINDPALYDNLNTTISRLQGIVTEIQRGRGTAGKLLTDEALYNETRAAVTDARTGIARLNRSIEDVNAIVADVRAGRGTAGRLLTDEALYDDARAAIARLNTTTDRIDTIVTNLQRGEGTAGRLLKDEALYNNINQLSSESVKLLYDFRQNPRKYLRIELDLF